MTRVRQFLLLAARECGDHLRHRYALAMLGAAAIIAPIGIYGGAQDLAARNADYQARGVQRDASRQTDMRYPGTGRPPPLRVLRTPSPGAPVVRGLDAAAPEFWDTGPIGVTEGYERTGTPELYAATSSLDFELVVRWLLGLAAVLLGAESLAGARRTGLLKTLVTYPVPPWVVIAGKLAGGAASALMLAMALAAIAGLAALAFLPPEAAREAATAACLAGGAGWLYLAALFAAGAAIGVAARSPQAATVAALTAWLLAAVVVVTAVGLVARATAGTQARTVFEAERNAVYDRSIAETQRELGAILREWVGPDGDTRNVPFDGELRDRIEARWIERIGGVRAELDALEDRHFQEVERQRRIARWLRFLSPGALLLDAASALAGTGAREAERRQSAVEAYEDRLQELHFDENRPRLNLRIPQQVSESLGYFDRRPGPTSDELPWFDPAPSGLRQRLVDASGSLAALAGYFVALSAIAIAMFRYRRDGRSDRE